LLLSGFAVNYITDIVLIQLLLAAAIYFILLLVTKQIKRDDMQMIREWLYKKQPAYI